jgi:predicted metal-binding membrane protein
VPYRATAATGLITVAGIGWAITAHRMSGMDMGPGTDLGGLGWFAVVWLTMMAAMMLPSLVPMALAAGRPARFAGGYLVTWVGAGVLAYAVFQGVRSLDISWLAWDEGGQYVAGGVILFAALYELTPLKARCLRHCRDPELLGRRDGAFLTGVGHGGFCVGSSGALMAALFALGVMNVTWMIVVATLIAIEKLLPWQRFAIGATAVLVIVLGLGVAFAPDQVPGLTIPG